MTADELTWEPPGPGQWYYSAEHLPGPVSTLFAELFPQVAVGWERGTERYGLPPNRGRFGPVGRFLYFSTGVTRPRRPRGARAHRRGDAGHRALARRPAALVAGDPAGRGGREPRAPGRGPRGARRLDPGRPRRPGRRSLPAVGARALRADGRAGRAPGVPLVDAARGWGLDTAALYEALAGSAASTASGEALFERIAAGLRDAGVHDVVDLERGPRPRRRRRRRPRRS